MAFQIDLDIPGALTKESVAELLRSKDDSQHRQLRVNKDGIAYLSDRVGADELEDVLFRFETWDMGNGYCGEEASADDTWVNSVYQDLKDNWPKPKSSYIG